MTVTHTGGRDGFSRPSWYTDLYRSELKAVKGYGCLDRKQANSIKTEKNRDYGFQTLMHGVFLNMDKF